MNKIVRESLENNKLFVLQSKEEEIKEIIKNYLEGFIDTETNSINFDAYEESSIEGELEDLVYDLFTEDEIESGDMNETEISEYLESLMNIVLDNEIEEPAKTQLRNYWSNFWSGHEDLNK
jgi:hypothetical protein